MKVTKGIAVCTPMYGGRAEHTYIESLLKLLAAARNRNLPMRVHILSNESLIQRARNTLVHDFLKTGFSHLMFIDADIGFEPNDVIRMIDADKDVIGGLYPKKQYKFDRGLEAIKQGVDPKHLVHCSGDFVFRVKRDDPIMYAGVSELQYLGTGFMMVKRSVFEALKPKVKHYFINEKPKTEENKVWNFFDCPVVDEELLSEDYYFCHLAIENGFKIHTIASMQLTHTGPITFSGCFFCSHGQFVHKLGQVEKKPEEP